MWNVSHLENQFDIFTSAKYIFLWFFSQSGAHYGESVLYIFNGSLLSWMKPHLSLQSEQRFAQSVAELNREREQEFKCKLE